MVNRCTETAVVISYLYNKIKYEDVYFVNRGLQFEEREHGDRHDMHE